jgi:hypothetical protein
MPLATHPPVIEIIVPARNEAHRLPVIGSRGLSGSVVEARSSALRGAGATLFRTMAHWILPGTADTQCGFKFFSGPLARAAVRSLRTAGFAFDVELLATCLQLGATVTEIPVQWRDIAGSTFSVRRHSAAVFRDLGAIWLRSRIQRDWSPWTPAAPAITGTAKRHRSLEDPRQLAAGAANP